MPIAWLPDHAITTMVWSTPNFDSGGGATTHGWRTTGATDASMSALADAVATAWANNLQEFMDTSITLDLVRADTAVVTAETVVGEAGTFELSQPPPNTALLTTYRSSFRGPRARGRSFWPGFIGEGTINERGIIDGAVLSDIADAIDAFFLQIENSAQGPYSQAVIQHENDGDISAPMSPWPTVVSRETSNLASTQRRRLRR